MAGIPVTGDQYYALDGKLLEIKRQLRQNGGYPFDPQQLDAALQAIIEGRFGPALTPAPVALVPVTLPFWLSVRLGIHKTAESYIAALEAAGMKVGTYARQILPKVTFASKEEEIEIFLGSARDFGFTRNTARKAIFERAALHGYYPCPAEVGPAGRLQYTDQPHGEYRVLAMEPIAVADRLLKVFGFEHDDDGVWLDTSDGHPGRECGPDAVWAWCRRKP